MTLEERLVPIAEGTQPITLALLKDHFGLTTRRLRKLFNERGVTDIIGYVNRARYDHHAEQDPPTRGSLMAWSALHGVSYHYINRFNPSCK